MQEVNDKFFSVVNNPLQLKDSDVLTVRPFDAFICLFVPFSLKLTSVACPVYMGAHEGFSFFLR